MKEASRAIVPHLHKSIFSRFALHAAGVSIALLAATLPARAINISVGNTVTESFSIGTSATATLPTDWKADTNTTARTVGTYSAALTATTQRGGTNMSTSATNGIYNYGAGDPAAATDRAVGFLSSSSATKSGNLYVKLDNNGGSSITSFTVSYNIEKYRHGSNSAGYQFQMYYSTDGSTWTSAGSSFLTTFPADADNNGYTTAPGVTSNVTSRTLTVTVAAGSSIYLAFNYSVQTGSTTSNAQGLGIDDFSITANGACTPPTITTQPADQTACANSPAQFTVATSASSPTYQWRLNGANLANGGTISGSGAATLTVTPTSSSQSVSAGSGYDCLVTAGGCSTNSERHALTVYDTSVGGTATAASPNICSGTGTTISLASSTGAISKWQYSSDNFSADTHDVVTNANPYSTGNLSATTYFRALVQNGVCSAATSSVAQVTVTNSVTPAVSIAITNGANPTCAGVAITFQATPTNGGGSPTYVWKTNSVVVTGVTGDSLTVAAPVNGETIDCQLTTSIACASPTTADATPITITISALGTPNATAATGVGSAGFTANWDAASCATSYKLDVATDSGFSSYVTGFQDVSVAGTSTNVTGLTPSTAYYYRVRAVGLSGTSGNSGTINLTTLSTPVVLAGWDVNTVSNFGPSPLPVTIANGNVSVVGLTRASGVSTSGTAAARAWGGLNWSQTTVADAIVSNLFVTFTITPNTGASVSFTAISKFDYRRSGSGASAGIVQYATDGATFHDIVTNAYASSSSSGASLGSIDLSGISALQNVPAGTNVTFRIVNYGATGSAGTWYIFDVGNNTSNDFEIVGTISGGCSAPPITSQPVDQTVCAGSPATYTVATSASGPSYLWRLNGVALSDGGTISGYNQATLTVTPTGSSQSVVAGAGYDCVVTSGGCSSNSERHALAVYDTSVGGTATPSPASVCSGSGSSISLAGQTGLITKWQYSSDNFAADVHDTGSTNNPYSTGALTAATYFRAIVQNGTCATATSSVAQVTISGSLVPAVSVGITSGTNPTCAGVGLTFTATPTNGGPTPTYVWKTNSIVVASVTGDTFTESAPVNGETIDCRLVSNDSCASPTTADATTITLTVNALATPSASAATGVTDTGFIANWSAATCATGYKLDVATDSGFASYVAGYQDLSVAGTSTNVTGLAASSPYYYRVRAVGASGTSGNSGTINVTTLAQASIIVAWDMNSLSGGTNNFGPTPYAATTNNPAVTSSGLIRGAGVGTNGVAAARAWGGNSWVDANASDAITSNRFATFTIAPNAGSTVSLTAISRFNYRRSGTGASSGVLQYSTDGVTFTNITTLSYTATNSAGGAIAGLPIVLAGYSDLQSITNGQTVTFRVVNYGGTSSAGTWYIFDVGNSTTNDLEVVGTVTAGCPTITINPSSPLPAGTVGTPYSQAISASGGTPSYTFSTSSGSLPGGLTMSSAGVISGTPTNAVVSSFEVSVSDTNGCPAAQSYSLTINCPTLTQFNITGGGGYCSGGSGVAVGLDGSQSGVSYQLQLDSSNTGSPIAGTGSALSFGNQTAAGTYTVVATFDSSACSTAMTGNATVTVNPLPTAFNVTGGGAYCSGGSGVAVGLDGSQSGVSYQLQLDSSNTGSPIAGTGSALSFGNQTAAGTYTVVATDDATSCGNAMTGNATVTVNPTPGAPTVGSNSPINAGDTLNLTASTVSGGTYNWNGPNGFSSTDQNPSIVNAPPSASGLYQVTVTVGSCTSAAASTSVTVNALPPTLVMTKIAREGNDIRLTWIGTGGNTNQVEVATGQLGGSYTNSFSDLGAPIILPGFVNITTNFLDQGGATNVPARYYRIHLVP